MSRKRPGKVSALAPTPTRQPRLTGWRRWVARGALAVLAPLGVGAVLELGLGLFDYGDSSRFFVKMEDGRAFTTNRRFGTQFMQSETATQPFPVTLPARKEAGTLRIFILGESAAQGTPAPQFGFGRLLELMLQERFPGRRFEIINAAMRGINSHAVRPIARECARHEPDLFLVYTGNNEVVGLHAPDPGGFNLTAHLRLIRLVQWFKSKRTGQLLMNIARGLARGTSKQGRQDMEFFRQRLLAADDRLRRAMIENFRANLKDVVRAGRQAGATVILSTLGANLQDFPPLGSLHRAGLAPPDLARWEAGYREGLSAEAAGEPSKAITHYVTALNIDDHFAELHFRLAGCHLATGDLSKAREQYALARDWDALQFRADRRLNQVIRGVAVAANDPAVVLVDAERVLAEASGDAGVPGGRLFNDHVHLTFDGDYLLARSFLPAIATVLGLADSAGRTNQFRRPLLSRQDCAEALGFTSWDELGTQAAVVRMMANPPFLDQINHSRRQAAAERGIAERTRGFTPEVMQQAEAAYRAALARRPEDWQIRYSFGNLLMDFGKPAEAAVEFGAAVKSHPEFLPARVGLGRALWRTGRAVEARSVLEAVLREERDYKPAQAAVAELSNMSPRTR